MKSSLFSLFVVSRHPLSLEDSEDLGWNFDTFFDTIDHDRGGVQVTLEWMSSTVFGVGNPVAHLCYSRKFKNE